jgi:DNA-binding NarL/FixJ family response regulator
MSSTFVALRSDLARLDGPSWQAADAGEPESTGSRSELIFEIRRPVAAIGDQAQLLRDRVANGGTDWTAISEGLQHIEQTATRVSRLLCELAETHAPGAGPGEALRRASADLVQFARSVGAKSDADGGPTAVHLACGERPIRELPGVLPLSSVLEADSVVRAVQAGAVRYLLHETHAEEAWQAIKAAVAGDVQFSHEPAARLAHAPLRSTGWTRDVLTPEALSQRELDVLRLVARGRSNKGIAHDLAIAENTVKTHVSSILGKLGLESRTQAALYAGRNALIPPDMPGPADPFAA